MAITFDDLQAAMESLRQEIPGLVASQLAASITGLRSEIDVTVSAALADVRQQNETTTQRVSVVVDEQFQKASAGYTAEQERVNGILRAEHDRLTQVLSENKQLLDQLSVEVKATVDKIGAVSEGELDQVASALIEQQATMEAYKEEKKRKVDVVHEMLSKEVRFHAR